MKLSSLESLTDKGCKKAVKVLLKDYRFTLNNIKNDLDFRDSFLLLKSIEIVLGYYLSHSDYDKVMKEFR